MLIFISKTFVLGQAPSIGTEATITETIGLNLGEVLFLSRRISGALEGVLKADFLH